jgi:hypothetical protein
LPGEKGQMPPSSPAGILASTCGIEESAVGNELWQEELWQEELWQEELWQEELWQEELWQERTVARKGGANF